MAFRPVWMLSLLAVTAAVSLRAGTRTRMRQIPLEIPIRVPLMVPLDEMPSPMEGPMDGPLPIVALGASEKEPVIDAPQEPMDAPQKAPVDLMPSEEASKMLGSLFDFSKIFNAGVEPKGRSGVPHLPVGADSVRLKTRPGNGVPTPLHLESRGNQVRIKGNLPKHLDASNLKVSQLGHVVAVQYMMDAAIGVEQNFQLDFEPDSVADARYHGSTGDFELVMDRPENPSAPKDVHVLFEDDSQPLDAPQHELPMSDSEPVLPQDMPRQLQDAIPAVELASPFSDLPTPPHSLASNVPRPIDLSARPMEEPAQHAALKPMDLPMPIPALAFDPAAVQELPSHPADTPLPVQEMASEMLNLPAKPADEPVSRPVDAPVPVPHLAANAPKDETVAVSLHRRPSSHTSHHKSQHSAAGAPQTERAKAQQARLKSATSNLASAFAPLSEPLVMIEVDN